LKFLDNTPWGWHFICWNMCRGCKYILYLLIILCICWFWLKHRINIINFLRQISYDITLIWESTTTISCIKSYCILINKTNSLYTVLHTSLTHSGLTWTVWFKVSDDSI
jgi:hypothetical protein